MSDNVHHLSPLLRQSSDILVERAQGMYVYAEDGGKYMDFASGIGVLSTGHCHPRVVEAAKAQIDKVVHAQYAIMKHPPILELSDRLVELLPDAIDSVFFSNAGTEAVEASIRLARQATGKPNIIAFRGCFHGRTMGSLSTTTSSAAVRQGVQPMMGGVVTAPFPDTYWYGMSEDEAADFALRELDYILQVQSTPMETAAMLIEPIQGEAGYIPANTKFMQGLQERCNKHGILLMMDEVQSGNGRTGLMWGYEHFGVEPDVVISAKGVASGFQLSFMAAPAELMSKALPGSQGGTYGGNAVACAAALATLDVIRDERLVENAAERGAQLLARLQAVQARHPEIGNISGKGLMIGTHFVDAHGKPDGDRGAKMLKACEHRGLLMIRCGPWGGNVIRWIPPLIVTAEEIDWAVDQFESALIETGGGESTEAMRGTG